MIKKRNKPYAIVGPNGLHHIGLHHDENDCWRVALGWPTVGEVEAYKRKGYYATEVAVTIKGNSNDKQD